MRPDPQREMQQALALVSETDNVVQLLARGLESLHRRDNVEIDTHATQQLLSQGLERFLKLTLVFQYERSHGSCPPQSEIRQKYGHHLQAAAEQVLADAADDEQFAARPAAQADLEFARADPLLQRVLACLSAFGQSSGRYHDLNTVLGATGNCNDSPRDAWAEVELAALGDDQQLLLRLASLDSATHIEALREVNARIIGSLQRYLRFLARVWAWSAEADSAKRYTAPLYRWLMLDDDQLSQLQVRKT